MLKTKTLAFYFLIALFFSSNLAFSQKKKIINNQKDTLYSTYFAISEEAMFVLHEAKCAQFVANNSLPIQKFSFVSKKTLKYLENNGYPFASFFLDSIVNKNDTVFAKLIIDKNKCIIFDTISNKGNAKISKSYLKGLLNFRKGKLYNEEIVMQMPLRISELPFASEAQPLNLEFTDDKASLFLFLDKKRCNQFDGYLGLVPQSDKTGKIALSGELNLHLLNVLTIGESIDLQWRATERYSQYLELKANFPYLFGTPMGIDGKFLLDKKDTTYLNMNYLIGLQYAFLGLNSAKVFFDYTTSSILDKSVLSYELDYSKYKKAMYGISFNFRKLDFLFNPRKGYELSINGAVGSLTIQPELSEIEDNNYPNDLRATRYTLHGKIKGYIPIYKRWVLVLGLETGAIFGKQKLINELFRIGGMKSLQGFDDLSIRASSYGIALAEVRFLVAKFAYINAFFNGAWYEQKIANNYMNDFPYGFGLGIAFDTKAGLFYLSYALGKQSDNPISFKTGKIHFGLAVSF